MTQTIPDKSYIKSTQSRRTRFLWTFSISLLTYVVGSMNLLKIPGPVNLEYYKVYYRI